MGSAWRPHPVRPPPRAAPTEMHTLQQSESIRPQSPSPNMSHLQANEAKHADMNKGLHDTLAMFGMTAPGGDTATPEPEAKDPQQSVENFFVGRDESWVEDDDAHSDVSSCAASIFSLPSVASTATDLAKDTGYSADDIIRATTALFTIVHEDVDLGPLYLSAINDPNIGPERLQRNLRRIFKQYGENLKNEAKDQLEFLAARLVIWRAGFLSQAIVTSYAGNTMTAEVALPPAASDQMEHEDNRDEIDGETSIEAAEIGDLVAFRDFLTHSNAWENLRIQVQNFIRPTLAQIIIEKQRKVASGNETEIHQEVGGTGLEEIQVAPKQEDEGHAHLKINNSTPAEIETGTVQQDNADSPHLTEIETRMEQQDNADGPQLTEIKTGMVEKNDVQVCPKMDNLRSDDTETTPLQVKKREVHPEKDKTKLEVFEATQVQEDEMEVHLGVDDTTLGELEPAPIRDRVIQIFRRILMITGHLEPPLRPEMVRIRWQCRCGENFTSDVKEYETDGASDLVVLVEKLTRGQATATSYSTNSTNQRYVYPRPILWLQRVLGWFRSSLSQASQQGILPQHGPNTAATPSATLSQQKEVHLLACMHNEQYGKKLHYNCITTIDTDRKLFYFLREQFTRCRGKLRTKISLKQVTGIYFVKFNLFMNGSAEVRHHSHCCERICECIPPQSYVEPSPQAQYRSNPAGPLKGGPPVLPDLLSHFFANPSCINEIDDSILNRLPKRICGELQSKQGEPAEGWGIYFEEGWNIDLITLVILMLFLIGSLLFGVLWAYFKMDVQGAFGVSAYVMTAAAILTQIVATRASKA